MRTIFAVLLLVFVVGCGESGPSREQAESVYNSEMQKLTALEAQLAESELSIKESANLREESEEQSDHLLSQNLDQEISSEVSDLRDKSAERNQEAKELETKEIDLLKNMIKDQKQRVDAARKAKDAAR